MSSIKIAAANLGESSLLEVLVIDEIHTKFSLTATYPVPSKPNNTLPSAIVNSNSSLSDPTNLLSSDHPTINTIAIGATQLTVTPKLGTDKWLLSLDGGGIRGLIHLYILARIEKLSGKSIIDIFDGISGTSIGGIIGCLLTLPNPDNPAKPKYSPQFLLDFLQTHKQQMFKVKYKSLGGLLGPRYKCSALKSLLYDLLGDNMFDNRLLPVTLVTHDLHQNKAKFIESGGSEIFKTIDVAMATGAAPTYFKAQHVKSPTLPNHPGYLLSDGGTCQNNPAMAGLAMLASLQLKEGHFQPGTIKILSIGTGNASMFTEPYKFINAGVLRWAKAIADTCINGTSSSVCGLMTIYSHIHAVGDKKIFLRLEPQLHLKNMNLANVDSKNIEALLRAAEVTIISNPVFDEFMTQIHKAPLSKISNV